MAAWTLFTIFAGKKVFFLPWHLGRAVYRTPFVGINGIHDLVATDNTISATDNRWYRHIERFPPVHDSSPWMKAFIPQLNYFCSMFCRCHFSGKDPWPFSVAFVPFHANTTETMVDVPGSNCWHYDSSTSTDKRSCFWMTTEVRVRSAIEKLSVAWWIYKLHSKIANAPRYEVAGYLIPGAYEPLYMSYRMRMHLWNIYLNIHILLLMHFYSFQQ